MIFPVFNDGLTAAMLECLKKTDSPKISECISRGIPFFLSTVGFSDFYWVVSCCMPIIFCKIIEL